MIKKRHAWLFVTCLLVVAAVVMVLGCRRAAPAPTPVSPVAPTATSVPRTPVITPPPVASPSPALPVTAPTPALPAATPPPTLATPTPSTPPAAAGIALQITEPPNEAIVTTSPIRVRGLTALNATVSVNGNIVAVAGDGTFSTAVNLLEGPNLIDITASDYQGNQTSQVIAVIYVR